MQYKGLKGIKQIAAVILSAALLISELPQTGIVYAAQMQDMGGHEADMNENEDAFGESDIEESAQGEGTDGAQQDGETTVTEPEASASVNTETSDAQASDTETSDTEASNTEIPNTETSSTESPDSDTETPDPEESGTAQTTETENESDGQTQLPETEDTQTETEETGTEATETQETETVQLDNEETASIQVPEVDTGVYQPQNKVFHFGGASGTFSTETSPKSVLKADENGVYTIHNKDEFVALLQSRENFDGKTVKLNCDVDMKNQTAGFSGVFSGKFDGNGHSIVNFKTQTGLFKTVDSNAEVKNLHISNASFDGTLSAGVIAGRNDGVIENCVVTGALVSTVTMDAAAGIAAQNEGTIRNCVFSGNITSGEGTEGYGKYIGGIAGRNNGTIEECHAVGAITTKSAIVAGIVADNSAYVRRSHNYMKVSGVYSVAGVAAENRGTIEDSRNYGNISLEETSGTNEQIGGICAGNTARIQRCSNYGTISGSGKNTAGIAGYTSGMITECGNYGEISGSSNVGGIAGLYRGTESRDISKSFNRGKITAGGTGVGGILGSAAKDYPVNVLNCYNTGQINTAVSGSSIGGVAGVLMTGSIAGCYNAGGFSLGDEEAVAGSIAGFLGDAVTCTGSYFRAGSLECMYNRQNESVKGTEYQKTDEELKGDSIISLLGDAYVKDGNGGYPVLSGQEGESHQYPVIYELNGGCLDKYFDIVDKGANVPEPEKNPIKNNAEFKGWFADKGLKEGFAFLSATTAPRMAYAKWEESVSVEAMELLNDSATLAVGGIYDIKVKYTPQDAVNTKILWKSDDDSVATVDEGGRVTAVKAGETVITGKLADNSLATELRFKVTVSSKSVEVWIRDANDKEDPDYGKDIRNLDIAAGDKYIVEAVISGEVSGEGRVVWSSTNSQIASVKEVEGQVGGSPKATITGVKSGDAIISVQYTDKDGRQEFATLEVTVCPLADKLTVLLDDKDVTNQTVIYDYATSKFVAAGTSKGNRLEVPADDLGVKISPSNASKKVEWKVTPGDKDDDGVIKIVDKYTGKIKALSDGVTTITVESKDAGKKSAQTRIKVMNVVREISFAAEPLTKGGTVVTDSKGRILLAGGQKIKLLPQFLPTDATDKNLAISISNKNVLEVTKDSDKNTYTVTAKDVEQDTEVIVTARSLDLGINGDGVEGTIKFIIKPRVSKINIYRENDMKNPVTDAKIGINPQTDDRIFRLKVKNLPDNSIQIVTWKSSNETIATVEDNKDGSCTVSVKEKPGDTVITATAADGSGVTAKTTVSVESLASEVIIKGSHRVVKGKTVRLTAEVRPLSAQNKEVTWMSLVPDVASVDPNTGVVTGKKAGDTQIIARVKVSSERHVEAYYAMTVTEPITEFKIIPYSDAIYDDETKPDESLVLNGKSLGLDPDARLNEKKLRVYVAPGTACQDVTWKSSNEKVATVSEDGIVTAVALGKATITATSTDGSGKNAKVTLNVTTLTRSVEIKGSHYVGTGRTIQLTAEVGDKDAANKAVRWSSSNSSAVSVNAQGNVTALRRNGTVTITAEAADGSGASDSYEVHILNEPDEVAIKSLNEESYPIESKDGKKIITCKMNGKVEGTFWLGAEFKKGAVGEEPRGVRWSSSNKQIATIDENGMVTVVADGTVNITAVTTDGFDIKDVCTLKIEDAAPRITGPSRVGVGKKVSLSAGKTAISEWRTSDSSVAIVSAKGQVTGKGKGTVTITAVPKNGWASEFTLEVTDPIRTVDIALGGTVPDGTSDNRTYVSKKKLGVDIIRGYNGNAQLNLVAVLDGVDDTDGRYVTWKSSKAAVAKVDEKGNVTPLKAGTAKITATAADGSRKNASVTVVVSKQVTRLVPEEVDLTENGVGKAYVAKGKTVQLKVGYRPLAATTKKATWKVADGDTAYVSVSKSGKVKAKSYISRPDKPYATVIATANDDSGVTCEFHVFVSVPTKQLEVTKKVNGQEDQVFAAKSTMGVDIDGGAVMIGTRVTNTDGNVDENQKVIWKSGNTKIVKVDSDGRLTGLAQGKTTLTATVQDGTKKQCKINVYVGVIITRLQTDEELNTKIAKLKKGDTLELSHYITARPVTATNQTLAYKSSNKKVIQISSKGKITVKGKGTATVTVSTTDGSNIQKEIPITIQ